MTVLENVELCDNGYAEAQEIRVAQKIKLRDPSYVTISARAFTKKEEVASETLALPPEIALPPVVTTSQPQTSAEIVQVVALNPRVAELVLLLEISGKIGSQGYKALKIKPSMRDNMEKNASKKDIDTVASMPIPAEPVTELEPESIVAPKNIDEPQKDEAQEELKVSKNGAAVAKVEKYTAEVIPTEPLKEEDVTVSPTVVEEESARPVSREVPLIAPAREVLETKKELLIAPQTKEEQKDSVTNILSVGIMDISSLADLREYLAKTARLKEAAEQAKSKEETAKKNAELAEQEAASRRDELVKTAEKIAAHQEELIAQTEKSNEQAHMYDVRRGQYESERDEYQNAINDMLAIMGDSKQENKGKIM